MSALATGVTLLLLEADAQVARDLTTLIVSDGPADASIDVVVVTSAAAIADKRPVGVPACVVIPLQSDEDADEPLIGDLRQTVGDVPVIALVFAGGQPRGLRAVRHGADDFVLGNEMATGRLWRAVSCVVERSRYRFGSGSTSVSWPDIIAELPDGLLVLDGEGRVASLNPAAARIIGVEPAELIGRPMTSLPTRLIRRDGTPIREVERPSNLALTSGLPVSPTTIGLRDPLGDLRWAEVVGRPGHAADGRVDHVVFSLHDVSDRVAADDDARFQSELLLAIGQAVVVTDPEDVVVSWNRAAEEMYGWDATEAVGQRAGHLLPPESATQADEVREAVRAGRSWTGELYVRHRDGNRICAFSTTTPVFDERGLLTAIIALSADVTEQNRAKEALAALSAIVTSTADAVFSKALDGTIRSWNRGAVSLYGYTEDEAVGQNVDILQPRGDATGEVKAILETVAAGGTVRDLDTVRRRRDGSLVHVCVTVSPLYDEDGEVSGASVIGHDMTDRKRLEEQLSTQATYDALTGLPNRLLLLDRIKQGLAAATQRGTSVAVMMLDLDQFGPVNAQHGYPVGDQVLAAVAHRLGAVVGEADTVSRLGGDTFVVVCEATTAEATALADLISAALAPLIQVDGMALRVSASIGIAIAPPLAAEVDVLLGSAQAATNEAKSKGRAQWQLFDAAREQEASRRRQTSDDLAAALESRALEVHYQPVIDIASGRLVGVEALTRWRHPTRGWIPPGQFVPLAEDAGLVAALDAYVLRRACADAAKFRARGVLPDDAYVAVNVSARNVGDGGLVDRVCEEAERARWPLDRLELEVTETALMGDAPGARTALTRLREMGVGIALDDFGTGYSSFTYLRQLPISTIKVDRAFVQHITSRGDDLAITASIIDLGRAVDVRTVAEGVETTEQLSLLHRLECVAGQGFLWSPAVSRDDLAVLVRRTPGGFQPAVATPSIPWTGRRDVARVTNEHGLHRIWQLHRDGASLTTIAAALNASDFHTPAGQRWHGASVARVIAGPTYGLVDAGRVPAGPPV